MRRSRHNRSGKDDAARTRIQISYGRDTRARHRTSSLHELRLHHPAREFRGKLAAIERGPQLPCGSADAATTFLVRVSHWPVLQNLRCDAVIRSERASCAESCGFAESGADFEKGISGV